MDYTRMAHCTDVNSAGHRWFWQNYEACMQWQERHKVAYWRSKALALEYERDALLHYALRSQGAKDAPHGPMNTGSSSLEDIKVKKRWHNSRKRGISHREKYRKRFRAHARYENTSQNCESGTSFPSTEEPVGKDLENESNADSVVDAEFIEFFKQSMKHKIELRARRKASEESDSTDSSSMKKSLSVRSEEMRSLYGKNSAMIQGMETAMQLAFERNCEILNPVLWPILPLKM